MRTSTTDHLPGRPRSRPRTLRAGIVLAAVASLALACSSAPSGGDSPAPVGAVDTEAGLRVGHVGPIPSLDPTQQRLGTEQGATFLLYDRLTQLDNEFKVKPMLATSWEFAPDGSHLDFTLREGVTFHDGTPVDAAAVKASIERMKNTPGSTAAPLLADIASVEAVDPTTARLVLVPGRGAGLPAVLASYAGEVISPKAMADGRDLATAPGDAGSGAYVVRDFKPNEVVTLERAPSPYWDADAAKPKTIEIRYMPVASVGLNALRANQLDMVLTTATDVQATEQLAATGAVNSAKYSMLAPSHALFMNPTYPAFSDPRVRSAISHAIDRGAICRDFLAGNCDPAVQPYPERHWAYEPSLAPLLEFTPGKAKDELAAAGVSDVSFPLVFTAGSSYEGVATVIQSQLAEQGITVELMPLPSAEANSGYREGRYPAYLSTILSAADPSQLINTTLLAGLNGAEAVRDQITPIVDAANQPGLTQEQRAEQYGEVWTAIAESNAVIPVITNNVAWAYSPKLTGVDDLPWSWGGGFDVRYVAVTE